MKRNITIVVTILQIIIITALIFRIYYKKEFGNKEISINQIDTNVSTYSPSGGLKYFYEPKPNSDDPRVSNWSSLFNAKYTINKDSLNERFDYSIQKPDGVFRIITLGDSITYGLYIDTKYNWSELLENKLNALKCEKVKRINVINLGVYGYDNQYVAERYKKRGIKYNPDLVIWLETDMLRMTERVTQLVLEKISEDATSSVRIKSTNDGQLALVGIPNKSTNKSEISELYKLQEDATNTAKTEKEQSNSSLSSVNNSIIDELGVSESVKYEKGLIKSELLKKEAEKADYNSIWAAKRKEVINELGIPEVYKFQMQAIKKLDTYYTGNLILVPLPEAVSEEEKSLLKDLMVKRTNGYFFDGLRDIFRLNGIIPNEGHPNRRGHRMIAEDMFNYIQANNLIPCN